jgi:polar amino acid transport system permease protein
MTWDQAFALSIIPKLLQGLRVTVEITLLGFAIAVVLGLVVAIVRRLRIPLVSRLFGGYVQFVRGTPLLVQAYAAFYVLPSYGLRFSAFVTGVIVMGINYSAYCAEVYRAGIEDVPSGQWEASTALSLPPSTTWGRVILPQAVRSVTPVLGNYLVQMFKDSAVLSAITVFELLNAAQTIGTSSFRYVEPLTLAGLLFLLISFPTSHFFRTLERRLAPTR